MATAEELMRAEGLVVDYLDIDFGSRVIRIPASIQNLGVESDDDTKRLFFRMPREYGEFELYDFKIRINYTNADGYDDYFPVVDASIVNDKIIFSWLVGRYAYTNRGTVEFAVCLKKFNNNYEVVKELNTTVASLPVLRGKEGSDGVVQQNPDIIEYLLNNMNRPSNEQVQDAVDKYLTENPVDCEGVTDEQIEEVIERYLDENDITGGSGATAEQLAQIEKNAKDIKTLSENQVVVDDTLSIKGAAADAYATYQAFMTAGNASWEAIEMVGATVANITRNVTASSVVRSGNTITVTNTLSDGDTSVHIITVNENDYPTMIVSDGVTCTLTWEGM